MESRGSETNWYNRKYVTLAKVSVSDVTDDPELNGESIVNFLLLRLATSSHIPSTVGDTSGEKVGSG